MAMALLSIQTRLTYDSNGKYPEEQSIQHHGHILPVLLHLVTVLHDPGHLRDVLDALHGPEQLRTEAGVRTVQGAVLVSDELPVKPTAGAVQVERRLPTRDSQIKSENSVGKITPI